MTAPTAVTTKSSGPTPRLLRIDSRHQAEIYRQLKAMPRIAGVVEQTAAVDAFYENIAQTTLFFALISTVLGACIAFGVIYNNMRIALAERGRELASLRILGFGKGEVSYILIGEMMLIALIAQPIGWLIGAWIASAMTNAFTSDLYAIPLVLKPAVFATGSLVVLTAAFVSVMIVRRRLDRLDLVSVMKTRE